MVNRDSFLKKTSDGSYTLTYVQFWDQVSKSEWQDGCFNTSEAVLCKNPAFQKANIWR